MNKYRSITSYAVFINTIYCSNFVCNYVLTRHMSEYKHLLTFVVRRYVVIATKPAHRLQIIPIVHNYREASPTIYPSYIRVRAVYSAGMRRLTGRQTDRQTHRQTHRRMWPLYISRHILTWNVIKVGFIVLYGITCRTLLNTRNYSSIIDGRRFVIPEHFCSADCRSWHYVRTLIKQRNKMLYH